MIRVGQSPGLVPGVFRDVPDGEVLDVVVVVSDGGVSTEIVCGLERRGLDWSVWATCDGRIIAQYLKHGSAVSGWY
jgi:hypothetical protein